MQACFATAALLRASHSRSLTGHRYDAYNMAGPVCFHVKGVTHRGALLNKARIWVHMRLSDRMPYGRALP